MPGVPLTVSLSVIETVAVFVLPSAAPLALLSVTPKVSVGSAMLSSRIEMLKVLALLSPSAQLSVPLVAV